MSRTPRSTRGGCPGALTKTEQLRQAKTAALVRDIALKEEAAKQRTEQYRPRKRVIRPEPKKVDFTKPGMTKSMLARVQKAEAFKQEYERQQAMARSGVKRTLAPIGGDARMGMERQAGARTPTARTPTASPMTRKSGIARPSKSPQQAMSKKTTELAKVMKADVIQAEPVGEGPIKNIVIPPGIVNEDRTTIVNIVPPTPTPAAGAAAAVVPIEAETSQLANRSIQVISDTLDEQDAIESSAVQNKLADLQQARRDFVIAVANVGGNAVHIEDEGPSPADALEPPPRALFRVPDVEDKYLKPSYGYHHPHVVAARSHIQKAKADMEAREAARRMEEEFERIAAAEEFADDLHLDVPFEEELFLEKDISWEEDEAGLAMPRPSRIKAHVPDIPRQQQSYQYDAFDPDALERFFDTERYPPCPTCGPPPGRETLNPDLWELEDPWYRPPICDAPDLIQFN